MKTFAAVAFALASVAYAQLDSIPSCALTCLTSAIADDGCDGLTDYACHCKQTGLVSTVTPCVQEGCTASEEEATIAAIEQLCADAGVTITIPSSGGTTTTATTTSTPANSETTTSEVASTSSVVTTTGGNAASTTVVTPASVGTGSITQSAGTNSTVTTASAPASYTGGAAVAAAGSFAGFAMAVAAIAGL